MLKLPELPRTGPQWGGFRNGLMPLVAEIAQLWIVKNLDKGDPVWNKVHSKILSYQRRNSHLAKFSWFFILSQHRTLYDKGTACCQPNYRNIWWRRWRQRRSCQRSVIIISIAVYGLNQTSKSSKSIFIVTLVHNLLSTAIYLLEWLEFTKLLHFISRLGPQ